MKNLLNETIDALKRNGLNPGDVLWVGSLDVKTSWDNFADIADVDYDSGYGAQEVADDLLVVGRDWWLERHEYDGAEWWEFKRLPQMPDKDCVLRSVVGKLWQSLSEINNL